MFTLDGVPLALTRARLVSVLIAVVGSAGLAPAINAQEDPIPVWIDPAIGVSSSEDANEMLAEAFATPVYLRHYTESSREPPTHKISNCIEYFDALRQGYDFKLYGDTRHQRRVLSDCEEYDVLKRISPSTVSHVRDFVLDEMAPARLPTFFHSPNCTSETPSMYDASAREASWADFSRLEFEPYRFFDEMPEGTRSDVLARNIRLYVDKNTDNMGYWDRRTFIVRSLYQYRPRETDSASIYYIGGQFRILRIRAKGDVNGDGLEDLIIRQTLGGFLDSAYSPSYIVVVTRDPDQALFRDLLEPAWRRCAEWLRDIQ